MSSWISIIGLMISVLLPVIGALVGIIWRMGNKMTEHSGQIEKLKQNWEQSKQNLEQIVQQNREAIEELEESKKNLSKELSEHKLHVSDLAGNFVNEQTFANFVSQQQEREEKLQRFLGRIEGSIERLGKGKI